MSTLTRYQPQTVAIREWDEARKSLIKRTVLQPSKREATDLELAFFAEVVRNTGLDPIQRQIYGVFRYDSRAGGEVMTIQTGIDGFRLLAERTGKYRGQTPAEWCDQDGVWVDVWLKDTHPAAARVGVLRAGLDKPIFAVATWREYAQTTKDGSPTSMWRNMPSNQLSKCAEALALRKAFPADMSGLVTDDEAHVVPESAAPVATTPEPEPVEATVVNADRVGELQAWARELVGSKAISEAKLVTALVGIGATNTNSAEEAVKSCPDLDAVCSLYESLHEEAAA